MSPEEQRILDLAQTIYLTSNGVYNDVDGQEQEDFIDMTINWINTFYPELELEADWTWLRTNDRLLDTPTTNAPVIYLAPDIQRLAYSQLRDVTIRSLTDNSVISTWEMVSPNQVYDPTACDNPNRIAVVSRKLVFSRALNSDEFNNGGIYADTIGYIPQLTRTDVASLDIVKPAQLIVLGVAKNQILPDVVNGALTPNYTQKYADMLKKAKDLDGQTTHNLVVDSNYGFIRGVF